MDGKYSKKVTSSILDRLPYLLVLDGFFDQMALQIPVYRDTTENSLHLAHVLDDMHSKLNALLIEAPDLPDDCIALAGKVNALLLEMNKRLSIKADLFEGSHILANRLNARYDRMMAAASDEDHLSDGFAVTKDLAKYAFQRVASAAPDNLMWSHNIFLSDKILKRKVDSFRRPMAI